MTECDEPQLGYCNLCGVSEVDHELHTCMGCNQLMCVDHGIEAVENCGKRIGCLCLQCAEYMIRKGLRGVTLVPLRPSGW